MDYQRIQNAFEQFDAGHADDALRELESMAGTATDPEDKVSLWLAEVSCYLRLGEVHTAEKRFSRLGNE